jgi:hypothetical protein
MRHELHLFPYKVSLGQPLSEGHKERRYAFCDWMLKELNRDSTFLTRIIWSDECSFHLDGWVNRQNLRFWGSEKPTNIIQHSSLSQKVKG